MCRHLGYVGSPASLAGLLFDRPHSLNRQSWAPSDMRGGAAVNADGFGVGWYVPGIEQPVRYRRAVPMWTDSGFASVAAGTVSSTVLAAVRSGTVGMPVTETACAPFAEGRWLFSHNGVVAGWPASVGPLARTLPVTDLITLDAPTDSALVWALVRSRLRAGDGVEQALLDTTQQIARLAPESTLNLMLTDGRQLVATTWGHSLSVLESGSSVVVGSEPWDADPAWRPVGERSLVVATVDDCDGTEVRVRPVESDAAAEPVIEVHLAEDHAARALAADARAGLTAQPKSLPPKWFYDARGSELFERVTRLSEYYPTRAEREILAARCTEIATTSGARTLVELGSGSSEKTRLLLDALRDNGSLEKIVVLDVSESALRDAAAALRAEYPGVSVHGVVGDFTEHLPVLRADPTRLLAFLGGTIGNLLPGERAKFLSSVRQTLRPGEWLLLGTDLVKDPEVLVRAYDDAAGVTAEFNRNVLHVLNRELGADFEVDAFAHVACWDQDNEWIEMRLRAGRAMRVRLPAVGLEVEFASGEQLRTEVSAKFRRARVEQELAAAGFVLTEWWTDRQHRFALSLSRAG